MSAVANLMAALAAGPDPIETELYGDRYFKGPYSQANLSKKQDAYVGACNPVAMAEVLAHIDAQAAEIERLKADAARYQWLRKTTNYATSNGEKVDVRNFPELWDASIDSMIAETPKEQP